MKKRTTNILLLIYSLLTRRERYGALLLILVIIVAMVFEVVGIGLIVPYLNLVLDPDFASQQPQISFLVKSFGIIDPSAVIQYATAGLILAYLLKSCYLTFKTRVQANYVYSFQASFSEEVFRFYLKKSFLEVSGIKSSEIIRNVIGEVHNLTVVIVIRT